MMKYIKLNINIQLLQKLTGLPKTEIVTTDDKIKRSMKRFIFVLFLYSKCVLVR